MPSLPGNSTGLSVCGQALVTEERFAESLKLLEDALRTEFDAKLAMLTQSKVGVPSSHVLDIDKLVEGMPPSQPTALHTDDSPAKSSPSAPAAQAYGNHIDDNVMQLDATGETTGLESSISSIAIGEWAIEEAHAEMLQPSVWETALFLGLRRGFCGNGALLLGIVFNIVVQLAVAVIIERTFPASPVDVGALEEWRHAVGHQVSQVNLNGYSLVSRVCSHHPTLSVANAQAEILEDAEIYITDGVDGPALCTIVLMVWFIMWSVEAERIIVLMMEMLLVPKSANTSIRLSKDGTWMLKSISKSRILFMIIVSMLRLVVSVILLWRGTYWLVYTTSITDLVLNGVALAFIFDIDELFYDITVPRRVKALHESLHIHTTSKYKGTIYTMVGASQLPIAMAMALVILVILINPNTTELRNAMDALCYGDRDFAIVYQEELGMHFYVNTTPISIEASSRTSNNWKAVDRLINGKIGAVPLPDLTTIQTVLTQDPSDIAEIVKTCEDSNSSYNPSVWGTVQMYLMLPEASSCKDVKWACANLTYVRMACPAFCGCHRSKPWTAFSEGCPYWTCLYHDESSYFSKTGADCKDDTDLNTSTTWRSYWQSLNTTTALQNAGWIRHSQEEIVDYTIKHSCSVISEYGLDQYVCNVVGKLRARHPLGSYCPETCRCNRRDIWGCPRKCKE